ncbi:hypothetical protein [Rhizobium sp. CSW-27]|uniref:hypothetical protein n=1 Tax=Rhizobium sp. CSW-27 TaxID=2839985 RepID=UPI001C019F95|nr:hypothetical protein [Rhizobium sp. CSW-27]MBT9371087.1 hypothetical protein [Rhizobium sp. CSW-27]
MIKHAGGLTGGVFTPDELKHLQRVFDAELASRNLARDSAEAAMLAAELLETYQKTSENAQKSNP